MDRTVLITGASAGIGRAIATTFAQSGYRLVITCRKSEPELLQLKNELQQKYAVTVMTSVGDVSDYSYVERLFHEIERQFGGIDILINNAGISYIGLLHEMNFDDWTRVVNTNLTAVFSTCKLAIPFMLQKKRGKIINISSVWGSVGASCEVAYSACKGGVNAFTKALAKELAPSNIQVNAISFGAIDTRMNAVFSGEELQALIDEIPAGRLGTPEEAALLTRQIAESGEYLTGQIITLDGGWT